MEFDNGSLNTLIKQNKKQKKKREKKNEKPKKMKIETNKRIWKKKMKTKPNYSLDNY